MIPQEVLGDGMEDGMGDGVDDGVDDGVGDGLEADRLPELFLVLQLQVSASECGKRIF